MSITNAQADALKAAIVAETDPVLVAARTAGATGAMADWYNLAKSPAISCWRTNVDPRDTDEATPWSNFDAITSAGKRDSYLHAFSRYPRDYSRNSVRKWVTDVWGNATAGSNAEAILLAAGVRSITRAEGVLGGNNPASTNNVSALKLTWEGPLSNDDIVKAINRP